MRTRNTEPEARHLAYSMNLHPTDARALAVELRSGRSRIAPLILALDALADAEAGRERYAINVTPPRPTWASIRHLWRRNTTIDEKFLADQYEHACSTWDASYAETSTKASNALVRNAINAMLFGRAKLAVESAGEDLVAADAAEIDEEEDFEKRFGASQAEHVFLRAIRPWPDRGWKGTEVGNVMFGKLEKRLHKDRPARRRANTPIDLYRLLYLTKPVGVSFDDMYGGCSLASFTSPCRRFAMSFYLHKYELAAYQYVVKPLAATTREERGPIAVHCGVPGADNGVVTLDKDAVRFFRMVKIALTREWDVYSGNSFRV